jgi:hypothetical protein
MKFQVRSAMECDLCHRQDALPDCSLCQVCGEAIARLGWIREQNFIATMGVAVRPRQANDAIVVDHSWSRFAG